MSGAAGLGVPVTGRHQQPRAAWPVLPKFRTLSRVSVTNYGKMHCTCDVVPQPEDLLWDCAQQEYPGLFGSAWFCGSSLSSFGETSLLPQPLSEAFLVPVLAS